MDNGGHGTRPNGAKEKDLARYVVRLTRRGNTFTGEWSSDLVNWQTLSIITIPMPADLLAGLAVTSHNTAATATAVFADPVLR